MPVRLETILGDTVLYDNNLVFLQLSGSKKPIVTVNYANELVNRFVVVEAPDNIGDILVSKFAKDEQELISIYDMEQEEITETHNQNERQRLIELEECNDRIIQNWQDRENRRIPDWENNEKQRRAEYDLEIAIKQEEAERALLSYPEMIFDALEKNGRNMKSIRSQYQQQGYLSELRSNWVRKFLSDGGIDDPKVLDEIATIMTNEDHFVNDNLKSILVEKLGIVMPEVKPAEPISPYVPEPTPMPEPKPKLEPKPILEFKESNLLMPELESVVAAAYKGDGFESLNLTQKNWDDLGFVPKEVYDKVERNVRHINNQYMAVKVLGQGNGNEGILTLVQFEMDSKNGMKSGVPKQLRPYFQRPTGVVEDAYALSLMLWPKVNKYLWEHEVDNEAFQEAGTRENVHLPRAIYKQIIGTSTPLITNLFPELTESSVSEEERINYDAIAHKARDAFEEGMFDTYGINFERKSIKVSANELVESIRHLLGIIPEELFELRLQTTIADWAKRTEKSMPYVDHKRHRELNSSGIRYVESIKAVGANAQDNANYIMAGLGIIAEGRRDEWKFNSKLGLSTATTILDRYGISYFIEQNNQVTIK